jgi:hypothetical protein
MAVKEQVQVLLNKKMDRQGFLKHLAIGMIALTGVGSVIKVMAPKQNSSSVNNGYGGSSYGG